MCYDEKVMKFQSQKNGSYFVCEKGTFSQIQSQICNCILLDVLVQYVPYTNICDYSVCQHTDS